MPEPSASARLFVSVSLAAPVREELRRLQVELTRMGGNVVHWTPPGQFHLTLRFFGQVPVGVLAEVTAALRRTCEGTVPFNLRAAGLGGFPNLHQPKILWVGMADAAGTLSSLREKIRCETTSWGEPELQEFSPHIAIGRVRLRHGNITGSRLLRSIDRLSALAPRDFGTWQVAEVLLMKSNLTSAGARYEQVAAIKLVEPR